MIRRASSNVWNTCWQTPIDDAVLFGRVGRDELLLEPIVPARLQKLPTLEDQPIVTMENWVPSWAQGSESLETGGYDHSFCLLSPDSERRTHSLASKQRSSLAIGTRRGTLDMTKAR